jgi:serine/threonine-protein kinase
MATVHLARLMGPEGFSRTVAVKQLHPQFSRDPEFVAMFLDEARLASRVRHPNVVSPLDVISCPPELFIVMEYVHGASLSRLLKRATPESVPPRVAAAIVGQILLGLHAAHEATGEGGEPLELVHRDVSPQNIMVTKDGVARIVDFGIAKAKARSHQTDPGKLKGKLGYMAPEQVNLQSVDRRADVFAVGVVLWELLCGRRLFSSDSPAASVQKLLHAEIDLPSRIVPDLPPALDPVVLKALARPTGERFESARAMAEALEQAVAPCSMLELASWVESLAGDELSARSELVLDVEALRFDEFTRAMAQPLALGQSEKTSMIAASVAGPAERAASHAFSDVPADHRHGQFRKGWLLPIAVTVAIVFFVLWGRTRGAPTATVAPVVAAHAALPAEPLSVNAALRTQLDASQEALHVDAALAVEGAASVTNPGPRKATVRATASARPKPASNCDVPYAIDKNGVKRFKEACF